MKLKMKIDYINDMYYLIIQLSHYIRKSKNITENRAQEMLTLTIDLMNLIELYLNDFFYDEDNY